MPKPVKDEIFGSRKSVLKTKLVELRQDTTIKIFENVFFVTCLHRINPDITTRYMILNECFSESELNNISFNEIIHFFKNYIQVMNVFLSNVKIIFKDLKSNYIHKFDDEDHAARFLLNKLNCLEGKLVPSRAKIKSDKEVSKLSKFLRLNVYSRLASTDLDFIIFNKLKNTLILIEEKLFVDEGGGSVGLVNGGDNVIYNRFFTHNTGFDFAYALNDIDDVNSIKELVGIIRQQISNANLLLNIFRNKNQARKFNTIIDIE